MHITLFFTYKTSLERWHNIGMFDREVALYKNYSAKGVGINFVTYGKKDHILFKDSLPGIKILCNHKKLPTKVYTSLIPLLHSQSLQNTDIIKTNQTPGGTAALQCAHLFGKPLLARCGYMHSEFTAHQYGLTSSEAKKALEEETRLFTEASYIEVTTPEMKNNILSRLPDAGNRITVIPNYVDTAVFKPVPQKKDIDLLFIGRFVPQKNLHSLLDALAGLYLKTMIIGTGILEQELKAKALSLDLAIEWKSNVPNNELPSYLNRSKIFILPSLYEGHPKTLIEAMACGLPVIGANSPGIRELITHMKTGLIAGTGAAEIRDGICELMTSHALRTNLGRNARNFALSKYSLDIIASRELSLINSLL